MCSNLPIDHVMPHMFCRTPSSEPQPPTCAIIGCWASAPVSEARLCAEVSLDYVVCYCMSLHPSPTHRPTADGDKCKFGHNLEAFLGAKPEDLPGMCPFSGTADKACPFGACVINLTALPDLCMCLFLIHELCQPPLTPTPPHFINPSQLYCICFDCRDYLLLGHLSQQH